MSVAAAARRGSAPARSRAASAGRRAGPAGTRRTSRTIDADADDALAQVARVVDEAVVGRGLLPPGLRRLLLRRMSFGGGGGGASGLRRRTSGGGGASSLASSSRPVKTLRPASFRRCASRRFRAFARAVSGDTAPWPRLLFTTFMPSSRAGMRAARPR